MRVGLFVFAILVATWVSGCLTGPTVRELEFPEWTAPDTSVRVLWSVAGVDPSAVEDAQMHWSVGSDALDRSLTASRLGAGQGAARAADCPSDPAIDCARWSGERFSGRLPPLEAGSFLTYQVTCVIDGTEVRSRLVLLETRHP